MLENLLSFSIATFFLALTPGPDNIYVLTQSLANGTKSGIATTVGLISGCIVHTTLLAFGISVLITASDNLFYGIKVFGALYLIYLAINVYRSDASVNLSDKSPKKSYFQLFKQGVIMNVINPKVILFFLAFFPGFLWDNPGVQGENTVIQFYVLGLLFMLIAFIVFSSLAIMAGSVSSVILKYKFVGVLLKWIQIIVFVGISVFILLP